MAPLTETDAERHLSARALTASYPGFVGLALDLSLVAPGLAGHSRLRHGYLTAYPDRVVVSGPPSPGLAAALDRMAEDLDAVALLGGAHTGAAVRVSLEAGTDDHSPTGLHHRWAVAQSIAPILTAAFANGPGPTRRPSPAGASLPDPSAAWARQVLDAPLSPAGPDTFRDWIRRDQGRPPTIADLERHRNAFRPPVAARGHLEIAIADPLPGDGWVVAAAVVTMLVEDPPAAAEALAAAAGLPGGTLADPAVAAAARSLFLSAYGALARHGAPRRLRDALAGYLERYVLRGRCPADDRLTKERQA